MARRTPHSADRLIDAIAGKSTTAHAAGNRRKEPRLEYDAKVALIMISPTGHFGTPAMVQGMDLSLDGMCVISRSMMYEGSIGAVQLVRSNGEMAVVGAQVCHCTYVGAMQHRVGLKFVPLPENFPSSAFVDRHGRMTLLDESLKHNAA